MSQIRRPAGMRGAPPAGGREAYHRSLIEEGFKRQQAENYEDAQLSYRAVLDENPSNADAQYLLGRTFCLMHRPEKAVPYLNKAVRNNPKDIRFRAQLAFALHATGQSKEALRHLERALRLDPTNTMLAHQMGDVLTQMGLRDKALTVVRQILVHEPDSVKDLASLTGLVRFRGDEPEIGRIRAAAARDTTDPEDYRNIRFALGKMENDLGNYSAALDAFAAARARDPNPINIDELRRLNDQRRALFTRAFFESRRDYGDPTKRPVFIVGMPRSGTSLTEQILSRHPDVFGAGELFGMKRVADLVARRVEEEDSTYPGFLNKMTVQQCRSMAADYLEEMEYYSRDAKRITDKTPLNVYNIGLIALFFPNASIIHCRRNPLDSCVSCFTSPFMPEHNYLSDLRTLGLYYSETDALMEHWKEVLPGRILTVRYEEMIGDFENQVRALVDHIGLAWNPVCLDFHESERSVRTVSALQVRRPIYSTSINRWKQYGDALAPLIEALGPLADDNIDPSA